MKTAIGNAAHKVVDLLYGTPSFQSGVVQVTRVAPPNREREPCHLDDPFANVRSYSVSSVFLGSYAVGKSTLVSLISKGHPGPVSSTVGTSFSCRDITLGDAYDRKKVSVQLWDTAGQERFKALLTNYTRDKTLAFIVFDVSRRETFDQLDEYRAMLDQCQNRDHSHQCLPLITLIACKTDTINWQVSEREIRQKARAWNGCPLYFMSCFQKDAKEVANEILHNSVERFHNYGQVHGVAKLPQRCYQVCDGDEAGRRGTVKMTTDLTNPFLRESETDKCCNV